MTSGLADRPTLSTADEIRSAFLAYRLYGREQLRRRMRTAVQPSAVDLIEAAQEVYAVFLPTWLARLIPLITTAYHDAATQTGYPMSTTVLEQLATSYANGMTESLHSATVEAMVKGFSAMINRKVPHRMAMGNAIEAFGISNRHVKNLVLMVTRTEQAQLTDRAVPNLKKKMISRFIEDTVATRARLIGEQESWQVQEQSKQIAWSFALRAGLLSPRAKKVWRTAADERVCGVCGPMDGKKTAVDSIFKVGVHTPPVHVNCRCTVELRKPRLFLIHKAVAVDNDWETQPRTDHGRFTYRNKTLAEPADDVEFYRLATQAIQDWQTDLDTKAKRAKAKAKARVKAAPLRAAPIRAALVAAGPQAGTDTGIRRATTVELLAVDQAKAIQAVKAASVKAYAQTKAIHQAQTKPRQTRRMYAVMMPRLPGIDVRGDRYLMDRASFTSDLDEVEEEITSITGPADEDFVTHEPKTFILDGQLYSIDENSMAEVLAWARARSDNATYHSTREQVTELQLVWEDTDEEVSQEQIRLWYDAGELTDMGHLGVRAQRVGPKMFSNADIATVYHMQDHLKGTTPVLLAIDEAHHADDVYEDNKGNRSVNSDGTYRRDRSKTDETNVFGRHYKTHYLKPESGGRPRED